MGRWKDLAMEMESSRNDSRLAAALGISQHELDQLDYEIEADTGDDDMIYNYRVEFADSSSKKILRKIKRLEDGCRVTLSLWEVDNYEDYEQNDYDNQYDAILGEKDYHQKFLNEISNLNQLPVTPYPLELILKRQIFISIIGALETFLSDTFISLTFESDEYFKNFIETHPDFKQRKFELREIFTEINKLKETAKKVMLDTIYHNLPTVSSMYTATFKVAFPSIKYMSKLISTRHDLVHRNGKTKEGDLVITSKEAIEELIDTTTKFVNEIFSSLTSVIPDNDDLPF